MSNPLTGDFEAVLQVSGSTVNRLLATMHQNGSATTDLPRFPHSLWFRIGDDRPVDGVRGSLQLQIGVPRVELIHGSTDRFVLDVGVRARYKPDPGATPLPAFIHGTVRAEYRIRDIDPSCLGWSKAAAANYLWFRVVKDSVRFQGTAEEDRPLFEQVSIAAADTAAAHAANEAKITKQVATLLATRFAARPHPVSKRFRRGSIRSLNAPLVGSAVVVPIGLSGEPSGQLTSVDGILLGSADFAIGVARAYILSLLEPTLAAIGSFSPTVGVHVHVSTPWPAPDIDISTVYRVHVNPPTVDWQPHGSFAVIKIKALGTAKTDSVLPDAVFEVDQDVVVNFDAGAERLWLSAGSRTVRTRADGIGSEGVSRAVNQAVVSHVKALVDAACVQAQSSLDAVTGRKQELTDQLRTIDDHAGASVNDAAFLADGIILRGAISLTRRAGAVVTHETTLEKDGFSALTSWLPGGRIDKLEWSWTWTDGSSGAANHDDRFVLRRPPGNRGRWGVSIGLSQPLPGLDGSGRICLRIKGVQVDAITGQFVPVESVRRCTRYGIGLSIYTREDRGRLFLHDMPELSRDVPFPQLALAAVGRPPREPGSNTLLVYLERGWDAETAAALRAGLEGTRRQDAGLVLLVLFEEGALESAGDPVLTEVRELAGRLGLATVVDEDVRGGWSAAYALRGDGRTHQAWRLLSPAGGVTWMHQGRLTAPQLASALDRALIPSALPTPSPIRTGVAVGLQVSATALHPGLGDLVDAEPECPPVTLGRFGIGAAVITFVQRGSASSQAQLRALSSRYGQRDGGPPVIVVVDGADARDAERMQNEVGFDFHTLADRDGRLTDRFGVRVWPTTITLDGVGTISKVEVGGKATPDEPDACHAPAD